MKIYSLILGVVTAGCASGLAVVPRAAAAISDEDFNSLKSMVQQLNDSVQNLKQEHNQDQQTIQQLREQLGQTQMLATNAVKTAQAAQVQAGKPPTGPFATHNLTMVGDAEVQFGKTRGQHSGFALADFAPIFLYRTSDNILFEAGFDITLQNGSASGTLPDGVTQYTHDSGSGTGVSMSFAQLDYLYNDYVTIVAGDMLLPLGTYNERGAGWLNKIPNGPMADGGILPGSGIGVQFRGAVPVGNSGKTLTYAVYGANGPSSIDGTGHSTTTDPNGNKIPNLDLGGNVGVQNNGSQQNLHANPSGGGRIGIFHPWKPHYDLELGISGQTGEWDDAGNHLWSAAVLDASLHLGPNVEIKGEYVNTWYGTDDAGTVHPRGEWVQAAYKLAGLNLDAPMINNVELIGRYDRLNDGLGTKTDRYTAGFIYYFTNTLLFEGDYDWLQSHGPAAMPSSDFVFQLSYGF